MEDLLSEAIKQAINLYEKKVGQGDLTTENIFPYARHTVAEIVSNSKSPIYSLPILKGLINHIDPTIKIVYDIEKEHPTFLTLEGNGRAIVTLWQVAEPLITMILEIQNEVKKWVGLLQPARIEIIHNFDLPPGFDKLMAYAVQEGGGITFGTNLDELVYVTSLHSAWVGSGEKAVSMILKEVGEKRSLIHVVVEITDMSDMNWLQDKKVNVLYCKGLAYHEVKQIGEITRGRSKLMVDESLSIEEVKSLRNLGIEFFLLNINRFLTSRSNFSISFK